MQLIIDPEIRKRFPDVTIGVAVIKKIDNKKMPSVIDQLLRGVTAETGKKWQHASYESDPMIMRWQEIFRAFGANPKKTPSTIEALLKRVVKGNPPLRINTAIDLSIYFSLKYTLPIGGIDLDEVCGDIALTYAQGTEPFWGIGASRLEYPAQGEVIYRDRAGVLTRAFNYRDCERTKLTKESKNVCFMIEDPGIYGPEKLKKLVHEFGELIIKYCGGEVEEALLGPLIQEIDLGVSGKTGLSDAEKTPDPRKVSIKLLAAKQKAAGAKSDNLTSQTTNQMYSRPTSRLTTRPTSQTTVMAEKIRSLIAAALPKTYPALTDLPEFSVETPKDSSHGDYVCTIALILAKIIKRPPEVIGEELIAHIERPHYLEKIEYAAPGFLNFLISPQFLKTELMEIVKKGDEYGKISIGEGKKMICEYSSPNVAKPLGAHHLLSTLIGQTIYNLHKTLGFDAISINYIGDWGTQFGKLIFAFKTWGERVIVETSKSPLDELLRLYVRFHDEAEKDPSVEDRAREEFKKLEDGDHENVALWKWFVTVSEKELARIYNLLSGIHFDYTIGESFFNNKMDSVIEEGLKKGIFTKGERGALIADLSDDNLPVYLIKKADEATLYSTRDLANIKYRVEIWKPNEIIYVVDRAQELHFRQLFATAKRLGWELPNLTHISFGRMQFSDKGMSTRKGNIIKLEELINEGMSRAMKLVKEKSRDLPEQEKNMVAEMLSIGAIKYAVLSQNRMTDITFDWDKMLTLEGNSAPYVQYAAARAKSILKKADDWMKPIAPDNGYTLAEGHERDLARLAVKFPEVLISSAHEYKPNLLTNYLYMLASAFNAFYQTIPVLQAESPEIKLVRLYLTASVYHVLKNGLHILGIMLPERM